MITITESAGAKIKEMMAAEEGNVFLRVAIQPGGCSGFTYGLGFDEVVKEGDFQMTQHGIPIVIDQESRKYLEGTVIDYKESMLGGGFVINNPNAISTCGCGSSFRTATDAGKPSEC